MMQTLTRDEIIDCQFVKLSIYIEKRERKKERKKERERTIGTSRKYNKTIRASEYPCALGNP